MHREHRAPTLRAEKAARQQHKRLCCSVHFQVQFDSTYTTNLKYYGCIQFHDGHPQSRVKALTLVVLKPD